MPLRRLLALVLAVSLGAPALADTPAPTAPKKKPAAARQVKHHVKNWKTPPGYRTPAQIEREEFKA